jgi:hypothetical protein
MKTCPFCLQEKEEFGKNNQLRREHLNETSQTGTACSIIHANKIDSFYLKLKIKGFSFNVPLDVLICSDCNNEIHYNYDKFYFKMSILHS